MARQTAQHEGWRGLGGISLVVAMLASGGCIVQFDVQPPAGGGGTEGLIVIESDPDDFCGIMDEWDDGWARLEADVLDLINAERAEGADCGSQGSFGPAGPLVMEERLRCAARNHSLDMATRGFFDHTNPDGAGPSERLASALYSWTSWGENIALGQRDAEQVVASWMSSPGHCASIMNPNFTELGVGYYSGHVWTQVFGRR